MKINNLKPLRLQHLFYFAQRMRTDKVPVVQQRRQVSSLASDTFQTHYLTTVLKALHPYIEDTGRTMNPSTTVHTWISMSGSSNTTVFSALWKSIVFLSMVMADSWINLSEVIFGPYWSYSTLRDRRLSGMKETARVSNRPLQHR